MNTTKQALLILLSVTLLTTAECGAQEAEVDSATEEIDYQAFLSIYRQIQALEKKVAELEENAYANDPYLRKFEEAYFAIRNPRSGQRKQYSIDLRTFLREERKKPDSGTDRVYRQLTSHYQDRFGMTHGNNNPDFEVLFKGIVNEKDMRKMAKRYKLAASEEDFASVDRFYAMYYPVYSSRLPDVLEDIKRAEERSGFPEEILVQIQEHVEREGMEWAYDAYIRLKTPAELAESKDALTKLYRRSYKIWPRWRRITREDVEAYLTRVGIDIDVIEAPRGPFAKPWTDARTPTSFAP